MLTYLIVGKYVQVSPVDNILLPFLKISNTVRSFQVVLSTFDSHFKLCQAHLTVPMPVAANPELFLTSARLMASWLEQELFYGEHETQDTNSQGTTYWLYDIHLSLQVLFVCTFIYKVSPSTAQTRVCLITRYGLPFEMKVGI